MRQTPAVAYYTRYIRTTDRIQLSEEIERAPLRKQDRYFLWDIVEGLSYKELSNKWNKSEARIAQWKREVFEKMTMYAKQKLLSDPRISNDR